MSEQARAVGRQDEGRARVGRGRRRSRARGATRRHATRRVESGLPTARRGYLACTRALHSTTTVLLTRTTYPWWIGRLSVGLQPGAAPRLSIVPQPSLATSSAATTTHPAFPLNPTHALAARRPIKPTSMSSQHALYTQTLSSCCIA